jgi:hypothetical protein
LTKLTEKHIADELQEARSLSRQDMTRQSTLIDEIRERVNETHSMTNRLTDALRLQWLRDLGSELKAFMGRIFMVNVYTYNAVLSLQSALPNHLERSMALYQEPILLEDAIGRTAPVHLQFITTWEMFDSVLELRFKNVPGFHKVQRKEYVLEESITRRDIGRTRPFNVSFLPGQKVAMSLIFRIFTDESSTNTTCPGCHFVSTSVQSDHDVVWYVSSFTPERSLIFVLTSHQ